jgi:DNA repair protein RadC
MNIKLRNDEKIRVLNGVDLYAVMQRILQRSQKIDRKKEHFWVVGLDITQEILFIELISLGTARQTAVDPMEVFSFALNKKAYHIVMAHNHPSGNLTPSDADKEMTGKMIWAGKFLNVPVWDHLIITELSYYSFLDSGLLDTLEATAVDVPDVIKEAVLLREKEAAEKDLTLRTAKFVIYLHEKGTSIEEIAAISELGMDEVQRLIEEFERGE